MHSDGTVLIFISYARKDNELPPNPEPAAKGFVKALREQLEYEFVELDPPTPEIWQDTSEVDESDQFDPRIEGAVKRADILVVVLSGNWLESTYCRKELDMFVAARRAAGLDEQTVRERIVVVGKRHVDPSKRPPELQGQVGYKFYRFERKEEEAGREVEFFKRGLPTGREYTEVIVKLANKTWRLTRANQAAPAPAPALPAIPKNGRKVYLAKTARDMQPEYAKLYDDLVGNGYEVVPGCDEVVPDLTPSAWVDERLQGAELAIHLLGELPGPTPDARDAQPIVKLQMERARRFANQAEPEAGLAFRRYVWVPEVWTPEAPDGDDGRPVAVEPIVRKFADVLARFDGEAVPSDLVDDAESATFRKDLLSHLELHPPKLPDRPTLTSDSFVYVLCNESDRDFAQNLRKSLKKTRGIDSELPVVGGGTEERNAWHDDQIKKCDEVWLCWANAPDVWVKANAAEFEWKKLGRQIPFKSRVGVLFPPESREKVFFQELPPRQLDKVFDFSTQPAEPPPDLDDVLRSAG